MTQRTRDKKALEAYLKKLEWVRSTGDPSAEETKQEREDRIERLKKDYKGCVEYYFPHYATYETPDFHVDFANKVARNPDFKGYAEWGRGLAKSVVINILLPFWLWLRGEEVYMVLVSVNHDKACQLLDDIRAEFEANPRIIKDFGEQKTYGSWDTSFFITKSGFIGQALGSGETVRGLRVKNRRPSLCNYDDVETKQLVKNPKRQDEYVKWVERDLIPTMEGKIKRFIGANNRFAPRMIQTILKERHKKWVFHRVNAYDPVTYKPRWRAKYDDDYYRKMENADDGIGVLAAMAEFNNEPWIEGKIFKDEMFQFGKLPAINHFEAIVGHWDVAYAGTETSDFNAVRVWGLYKNKFYLIDCFVKQTKMKAAVEWIADYQKHLPESAIVHFQFESQFWNDELERIIMEVEDEQGIDLNLVKTDRPKVHKLDRIMSLHPYYQNNRIVFSEKLKGHNDAMVGLAQLKSIEPGYTTKDDAPDADEGAIKRLSTWNRASKFRDPVFGQITHKMRF